jgi:hypothetical protein
MQWFLGDYLRRRSVALGLGLGVHVLIPKQLVAGTEIGEAASKAYAASAGLTQEKFMQRWKAPLLPAGVADAVFDLLTGPAERPLTFGVDGQGIAPME